MNVNLELLEKRIFRAIACTFQDYLVSQKCCIRLKLDINIKKGIMQVAVGDEDPDRWIPFSERSEWSDVKPVPQDDGPYPIVSIAYTNQFRETMDYFRAVLARDERTDLSLELTEEAIHLNAANYTVWHFRRLGLHWVKICGRN